MWKSLLSKTTLNVFIQKAKVWLTQLGFTNLGYLTLFVATILSGKMVLGMVGLGFLQPYLAGAFIGIFCYINWNLIVKIYKTEVKDLIEDKLEDIKNKIK